MCSRDPAVKQTAMAIDETLSSHSGTMQTKEACRAQQHSDSMMLTGSKPHLFGHDPLHVFGCGAIIVIVLIFCFILILITIANYGWSLQPSHTHMSLHMYTI